MKLAIAATVLAYFAPSAIAGTIPDGFYEQCCLRENDRRERRERRELGNLNGLGGYIAEIGDFDERCKTPASDEGTPKGDWICYTYDEVCRNQYGDFFNPSGEETLTNEICNNGANCFEPAPNRDAECVGGNANDFPDIWWTCFAAPQIAERLAGWDISSFHCGFECKFDQEACGDPHFRTFDGKWFDFHGECDLLLLKAEEFGMGLGLEIQVRTKGRYEYSFIESAALKIGDDILEISSFGDYAFNGVNNADLSTAKFGDMYSIEHVVKDSYTSEYTIRTGGSESIRLKSFKDLVSVRTSNTTAYNFGSSEGLMGDFFQGQMLARDGTTIISNPDEFGLEWQVTDSDSKMFQSESPVVGKCIMPSERVSEGRRLGASIPREAALRACAHLSEASKRDNCVYDVVATGDLETAKSY